MAENKTVLTPEGRQKLIDELEYREGPLAAEIVERIKEARGFGDLSENAEYDSAKEEQSKNESRINEIRAMLATAIVSDDAGKATDVVSIADTVEVEDDKGKKQSYTIVGTNETDSLRHMISNESPLGAALIGAKKGDKVEFDTPAGKKRVFTIKKVIRETN